MTSLEFFHQQSDSNGPHPDWGTGRHGKDYLWLPRAPTWHATGLPMEHYYQITGQSLSNVRDNDELIPRPQSYDITKKCINQPFPAEHPFASHIEKFALIPKFDSPQDPKRGVVARQQRPISDEMPANPYKTTVLKKTKGFPYREEIITIPSEGKKDALYWQGQEYFNQQSKIHGNRQQYYPIPPKIIAPNLQDRPQELCISEKTQNVLRNIERNQWIPSQKLDYSGLGPSNPMVLDNLDCKKAVFFETGVCDNNLYPHSINTYMPAVSLEGQLQKLFAPAPGQQSICQDPSLDIPEPNRRKMTAREKDYDELLNGREFVNLPETCDDPLKKLKCQEYPHPVALDQLQNRQQTWQTDGNSECAEQKKSNKNYLEHYKNEFDKAVQGMEARNRWRLLESSTPSHDVKQLREKYKMLTNKEMVKSFYNHEGKYNEERAGLYKTSYDPQRLAYSMNAQQVSGGALLNTTTSHVDAGLYPTSLWDENEAALRGSHTVVFKNSELSGDRPSSSDILNPYGEAVNIQRHILQPDVETARPLVQEGEFILKEDVYGDSYNTKKFLQERRLHKNIRMEPRDIISVENQNLERTREMSCPIEAVSKPRMLRSVHFSDPVNIRNMHENVPVRVEESLTQPLTAAEKEELGRAYDQDKVTHVSYLITHPERSSSNCDSNRDSRMYMKPVSVPTIVDRNRDPNIRPDFVNFTRDPQLKPAPLSETTDKFRQMSVNFMSLDEKQEQSQRSPHSFGQFTGTGPYEMNVPVHFNRGSCLMEMQNNFTKTDAHKRLHQMFPESNPDIRANFTTGKKKNIVTFNAQVARA